MIEHFHAKIISEVSSKFFLESRFKIQSNKISRSGFYWKWDLKQVWSCVDLFLFLQLIVEISSVSPESLSYCTSSGLITQLLRELTGEDVLVR